MKLTMKTIAKWVGASAVLVYMASAASAVSVTAQYDVTAAVAGGGHDHVLWIPSLGFTKNEFVPAGTLTEFDDGTATISGMARLGANGFDVDGTFTGRTAIAPPGSPKYEGNGALQAFQMANSANWWYYTGLTGTLKGVGSFAGDEYYFVRYGPAFQLGVGANLKNQEFGGAAWLSIYARKIDGVEILEDDDRYHTRLHGDFNWDLESVPDSGSLALMLGGALAGLALMRRRLK